MAARFLPVALAAVVAAAAESCGGGERAVETKPAVSAPEPARPIEQVDGSAGRIRVDDGGSGGVPVLFVHGLAGDRTIWAAQLAHLRASRRAIALDLRGHGDSAPASDGDYSIPALVSDVVAVANALELKRFVLAGHSLGAAVAAGYAGACPERVAGLLLVDPSGDNTRIPRGEVEAMLRQMEPAGYARFMRRYYLSMLEHADPPVRSQVLKTLRRTRRRAVVGVFKAGLSYSPVSAVERFSGPKLAVVAAQNQGPMSLPALLPSLPTRVMRGVSHWPMMDRPEEFDRILDEFLAAADLVAPR